MFEALRSKFDKGELKPLPVKNFSITEASEAFRYMAQRKNIGKIVLENKIPASKYVDLVAELAGQSGGAA